MADTGGDSSTAASLAQASRRAFPPMAALRAFDAVLRLGGVRRAASALSIDHAAVTRHVRTLERWTGATLVIRTKAGVRATEAGSAYHARLAPLLDALAAATLDLANVTDDRRIRIWCAPGLASQWLSSRFGAFHRNNPDLDVELKPSDVPPDFAAREADVHIHYAPPGSVLTPPPAVRAVLLTETESFPVASPAFLQAREPIRDARDIGRHALLHEDTVAFWRDWMTTNGLEPRERLSGPRLWGGRLTMEAARAGEGMALGCHFLAYDDLAAGRLVEVVATDGPLRRSPGGGYHFMAARDRWDAPSIARFRQWITALVDAETENDDLGAPTG